MTTVLSLHPEINSYVKSHNLTKKFTKQVAFLATNPKHPSLHVELLHPKDKGIYSFRLDRKYRALFIFRPESLAIEILAITDHYQ